MVNQETLSLIKSFEGLSLKAYPDPATHAEPYTIGWGTTIYPNGKKVKLGDVITLQQAEEYFEHDVSKVALDIIPIIHKVLTPNQFGALVSFAYNVGEDIDADTIAEGLGDSTLLKKININPSDPSIRQEFLKWNRGGGHILDGLTRRRNAEADLYFKP